MKANLDVQWVSVGRSHVIREWLVSIIDRIVADRTPGSEAGEDVIPYLSPIRILHTQTSAKCVEGLDCRPLSKVSPIRFDIVDQFLTKFVRNRVALTRTRGHRLTPSPHGSV